MAKTAEVPQDLESFLVSLLDLGAVEVLFCPKFLSEGKVAHALIPKEGSRKGLAPLFPFMPANGGKAVSQFTLEGPVDRPVAVVLRPCEIRVLVELVKLEQANLDNLYIIGLECGGVYPLEKMTREKGAAHLEAYNQALKEGQVPQGIREVCGACDLFQPMGADVVVSVIGRDRPQLAFLTGKGLELASKVGLETRRGEVFTSQSQALLKTKAANRAQLLSSVKERVKGYQGLLEVFGKCIGCHNCSKVCPICYCKDCFFESATFDYEPISYTQRLEKKGALRVPMDTILFHLGRMTHMATSCVACGMCEDACPMGIPVAQIFKAVGADVQELFEYLPGRGLQEELPLTTYRPVEFTELEE